MEAPSMCARRVEQLFMPLDLGHRCHGLVSQMTSWLNCPQNILHPNHHPIWHLLAYPSNMLQTSKLWRVAWWIVERNLWFLTRCKQKIFWGNSLTLLFFALMASCSFAKPYNDGITFFKHLASPQSHMPMYTTFGFFSKVLHFHKPQLSSLITTWTFTLMEHLPINSNVGIKVGVHGNLYIQHAN